MPGTKEIRTKIASVKSTQKITKAMQMVATSKMRRVQERMRLARPYAAKIRNVIGHLTQANPDYRHPFMLTHAEAKAVGIIVISTDRGLAGGLNANVFKQTLLLGARVAGQGRAGEPVRVRHQGAELLPPPEPADPRQCHQPRRSPAGQGPDRRREGDAGRLRRGQASIGCSWSTRSSSTP